MSFRRSLSEMSLQASERAVPVPPSYSSLHRDAIPMVEASSFSNSAHLPLNHHAAENRKSHALSIAQALDEKIRVEGWPEEPRKLRNKTLLTWFFNLCEILITLAPIAFLSMLSSSYSRSSLTMTSLCYTSSQVRRQANRRKWNGSQHQSHYPPCK